MEQPTQNSNDAVTQATLETLGILQLDGSIETDQQSATAIMNRRDDVTGQREKPVCAMEVTCKLTAYLPEDIPLEPLLERIPAVANDPKVPNDMRLLLHVFSAGLQRRMAEYRAGEDGTSDAAIDPTNGD